MDFIKLLVKITISLLIVFVICSLTVPQYAPICLKRLLDKIVYTHQEALPIRFFPTGEMLKEVIASSDGTLSMIFYVPGDTLFITYLNSDVSVWNGRTVVEIKRQFNSPLVGGSTTSNILVEKHAVDSLPSYIQILKDWQPETLEKFFRKKYEGSIFEITPVSGVLRIIILKNGEYMLEQVRCFSSDSD